MRGLYCCQELISINSADRPGTPRAAPALASGNPFEGFASPPTVGASRQMRAGPTSAAPAHGYSFNEQAGLFPIFTVGY
jgi:hypothetical protein